MPDLTLSIHYEDSGPSRRVPGEAGEKEGGGIRRERGKGGKKEG